MQANKNGTIPLTLTDNLILASLSEVSQQAAKSAQATEDYAHMLGGVSAFHRVIDRQTIVFYRNKCILAHAERSA